MTTRNWHSRGQITGKLSKHDKGRWTTQKALLFTLVNQIFNRQWKRFHLLKRSQSKRKAQNTLCPWNIHKMKNTFLVNGNSGLGLALKEVSFAEIKKPDYLSLCRLIYAWSEDQHNSSCCVQKNKKGSYKECSKEKASQKLSSSQLILKWKSP